MGDNNLTRLDGTQGTNEFREESGVLEQIDKFFGIKSGAVSEQEAKDTVSEESVGNISKKKREDLLHKIQAIRDYISAAPQDENTGNLLAYLSELEKDVNGKKYGLVFEEHREEIDGVLDTHTPVLSEEKELFIDNGGQMNFLIEGDNLAALKLLEKTHRGKIDIIFIDPPYNTKNGDFGYDDIRVDSSDSFRHSKWISFMNMRLQQAKKLLNPDGVIFITIDDNEQAAIKLVCDQIFGENNFLANIIWQHSIQPKGYSGTFSVHHNYLLCYQKTNQFILNSLPRSEEDNKAYSNPDNDPRGKWRSGDVRNSLYRPNLIYDIISPSGNIIKPCPNGWRWSKETVEEKIKTGEIIFSKDETRIIRKIYLDTVEGRTPETIWFGKDVGTTRSAMEEIKEIFGSSVFATPKPTGLIERILKLSTKNDAIVLDFFAGSGTTGHAVMKLNAEDGGSRRFILCTNNENNICRHVTYERIKRVIDKESYAASLKYYRVDYVPIDERMYYEYADELLKHIRELVELENGVNFIGNAEIGIVLTEEELEAFASNADAFSKCKKLYMGHDLLPTREQEKALAERGIEISIIPDYYYRDLQER